jgi:hypothetical protein
MAKLHIIPPLLHAVESLQMGLECVLEMLVVYVLADVVFNSQIS